MGSQGFRCAFAIQLAPTHLRACATYLLYPPLLPPEPLQSPILTNGSGATNDDAVSSIRRGEYARLPRNSY
ncbi:hypothetical protein BDZ45DRAFT_32737 [Acephala macrosclerotiorum]|nr:hypothetical protein BDZ45DRAFT_32737 [Acephala macrosclerotiorum]